MLEDNGRYLVERYDLDLSDNFFARVKGRRVTLDLLSDLGITYKAPIDMKRTPFEDNSFDVITNTSTLEHILISELPLILTECKRILIPNGYLICSINLGDHYKGIDML